jgi:hypothetical protein
MRVAMAIVRRARELWSCGRICDADGGYEPATDFWSRFLLNVLAPFVPEKLL